MKTKIKKIDKNKEKLKNLSKEIERLNESKSYWDNNYRLQVEQKEKAELKLKSYEGGVDKEVYRLQRENDWLKETLRLVVLGADKISIIKEVESLRNQIDPLNKVRSNFNPPF